MKRSDKISNFTEDKGNCIDTSLVEGDVHSVANYFKDLNGLKSASGLPDCEANALGKVNSAVASFGSKVMPEFFPNVINCGMGVMKLHVGPDLLQKHSHEIVKTLHEDMQNDPWVLDREQFVQVLEEGAGAFARKFAPEKSTELIRMFEEGKTNVLKLVDDPAPVAEVVPDHLLRDRRHFSFPENRIRKNHFLEFYSETNVACTSTYDSEYTYCAFHFESSFCEELNSYYLGLLQKDVKKALLSRNPFRKIWGLVKLIPKVSKKVTANLVFHLQHRGDIPIAKIIRHFVSLSDKSLLSVDTPIGKKYLQAYSYAANHASASRFVMMLHIARSVEKVLKKQVEWEIVWESGHDNLEYRTDHDDGGCIFHRIGSVPTGTLEYGFIAGLYNVPSVLLKKNGSQQSGLGTAWKDSYDHGMGNIQKLHRNIGETKVVGMVERFRPRSETAAIETSDITSEEVYFNTGLQKVIDIYSRADAPVKPERLLIPFISYKWVWKKTDK